MPTYIATGRDLTLTLDGGAWSPQTGQVTLSYSNQIETYQTLSGPTSIVTGTEGTLDVTAFADTGEVGSLFDSLWAAADTGASVAFALAVNGKTFSGDCIPQFPTIGGAAEDALSSDISFVIDGSVTLA